MLILKKDVPDITRAELDAIVVAAKDFVAEVKHTIPDTIDTYGYTYSDTYGYTYSDTVFVSFKAKGARIYVHLYKADKPDAPYATAEYEDTEPILA